MKLSRFKAKARNQPYKWLKGVLWLYFFLLIFEGGIRRWVLPGLAEPLLIIRDPVAILILYLALRKNVLVFNGYLYLIIAIASVSFFTTMFLGHGNLGVAIFGARVFLIHFPLIFIIKSVLNTEDINKISRWMIILCIPMLALTVIQFYSPQTAWINKGYYDSTVGAGFRGANGFYRPPGTFSFINGLSLFFITCSAFIFYALTRPVGLPKWVVLLSLVCLLLSIPFSISRTSFFGISLTFVFFIFTIFNRPKILGSIIVLNIVFFAVIKIFSNTEFLGTGISAFTERFTSASISEGGVGGSLFLRVFGGLVQAVNTAGDLPFFGLGIGMGTNVGSKLLSGKLTYLISEDEWGRMIGELGVFLGFLVILTRFSLAVEMVKRAFRSYKLGNYLPWLLAGSGFLNVLVGLWGQPSALGFSVFFAGVLLAATKKQIRMPF